MSAFASLVRLRVVEITRSASGAFFFLVLPLALLLAVGAFFANGHPFERRRIAIVSSASHSLDATARAFDRYPEIELEPARAIAPAMGSLRAHMLDAVLIPPDHASPGAPWRIIVGPRGRLVARGIVSALPVAATVEVVAVPRWGYTHYLFPGLLTFTVLIAGLFGMGYPMVRFRQNQFLKKLALTPLRKSTFVAAQIVSRSILVSAQLALMIAVECLAFDLPVTAAALAWLVALTELGLLVFMGIGFALACVIKNDGLMVDVISAITTPLVLLSETFFPASALPAPLHAIAVALPSTQMIRLTRAVLFGGTVEPAALMPGLAVLFAWLVVTYGLSVLLFRWHE